MGKSKRREDHSEQIDIDWDNNMKMYLKKNRVAVRTEITWLRIRTSGRLL
jgi:hypothetical protein